LLTAQTQKTRSRSRSLFGLYTPKPQTKNPIEANTQFGFIAFPPMENQQQQRQPASTKSRFRRVCVFCGSSPGKNPSYQLGAIQLGKQLVPPKTSLFLFFFCLFVCLFFFFFFFAVKNLFLSLNLMRG
jgi:hypothetical protein